MHDDLEQIQKMLIKELELYFGTDIKRINHAKKVLKYARELLAKEQADPYVVIPAAILHDVGIKVAEEKYGSSAAHYQEQEGPAVAGRILVEKDYDDANIYEICAIIAHHHTPGPQETTNFKVVYDADWLVNLADEMDVKDTVKLKSAIDKIFLTETGKTMAMEIFLNNAG
ncbi:MAG: HD domain-containing protein [Endomicrobiales bacterium]|jgi:HD superfamily phosphohydrolase YqeK